MNKLLLSALILLAGMTASSDDSSAQTIGTFCSASTPQGLWAMQFGPVSAAANCGAVRRQLAIPQNSDYNEINSGYYNIYGVNRVLISCGFYFRRIITSSGDYALQNAINTASNSGLTHCRFAVNGF